MTPQDRSNRQPNHVASAADPQGRNNKLIWEGSIDWPLCESYFDSLSAGT
jgi:hypothetical protein